jgi:glycerophosphoryl diester phosphodiesterase
MPFKGYTQQQYAQDFINTFRSRNISPDRVWPQSFLYDDILFWLKNNHDFGRQAIYLQEFDTPEDVAAGMKNLSSVRQAGVNIIGAAIPMLITTSGTGKASKIVPSAYAHAIKANGMDIIPWTFERSGPLATVKARGEYYFSTVANVTTHDGQYYEVLDVLANQIGVKGLFSDWASTVTYFANCFDLKGPVGGSYK